MDVLMAHNRSGVAGVSPAAVVAWLFALLALCALFPHAGGAQVTSTQVHVVLSTPAGLDRRAYCFPLETGERFSLSYIHSVERTRVHEEFTVGGDEGIVLAAVRFQSLGAGLPYSELDGRFRQFGDWFVIDGLAVPLGALRVLAVPMNEYRIDHPTGTIALKDAVDTRISIHVGHTPCPIARDSAVEEAVQP